MLLVRFSEKTMQTRIKTFVAVVGLLLIGMGTMFAQATQPPGAQSMPTSGAPPAFAVAQPTGVSDDDIAMLRADLRSKRKQITAQNMNLTTDEAAKFWPVYDQYVLATIKQNDVRWAMIKDYAVNYSTMTDAQAQDYIKRSNIVDQQLLALRLRYVSAFEKVVSAKKAALWYQVDRRIDLLINLQISSQIPMIDAGQSAR
jgi:hypothetical protein